MGDMKTPDFDDLLAAFDIPDIDAKEAIQSTPEEVEGHNALGKPGDSSAEAIRSNSPLEPQVLNPPAQGDISIVSVIVKNRVKSDNSGGTELDSNKESMVNSPGIETGAVVGSRTEAGGVLMGSRLGPRLPGLIISQPPKHNGFGTTAMSQTQSNGEIWPSCSPKTASEGGVVGPGFARRDSNALDRSKPLMGQSSGDPTQQGCKIGLLQQPESSSAPSFAIFAPGVSTGMSASFFPLPKPVLPTTSCPSFLPASPQFSSPGIYPSPPLQTSPMFNGSQKVGSVVFHHLGSDEEDPESDHGSPLVIQESPESAVCTPPKLSHYRSTPTVFQSTSPKATPPATINKLGGIVPCPKSPTSPSLSQFPENQRPPLPGVVNNSGKEERNPEHVIEKRDSPESPEPEIPKLTVSTNSLSIVSKDNCNPALDSVVPEAKRKEKDIKKEEVEPNESKTDGFGCDKTSVGDVQGESGRTRVKMEAEDKEKTMLSETKSFSEGSVPPSRPLKVRIKTIKTSCGNITRTVSRVAPKVVQTSKALSGGRVVTSRQRKFSVDGPRLLQAKTQILPLSTLQDASSAMRIAVSKAQSKLATSMSDKGKMSSTAGNASKSTTIHSISCVPGSTSSKIRRSIGGASLRSTAEKSNNNNNISQTSNHQLSKPASIVNSASAVISRSQSSLVEAFNKILNSKNLLPSYRPDLSIPPPAEWSLPIPASGYRCLECGDTFALERSLARHYDRRSLRIEVTCNHCAKRLAFFNKCSLLLHAREHKESGLVMQCSHLVMRPVPIEQMIGQQDTMPIGVLSPALPSSLAPSVPLSTGPVASSAMKEGRAPQHSPARRTAEVSHACLPLPCLKVEQLQYHSFKCPECHVKFGAMAELAAHFQHVKPDFVATCMLCSPAMMLPNSCSAAAHQRIHKHRAPHVCPECGGTARQASFQAHLDEACVHFARRIGYRCSSCSLVFGGLNSIKTHIQVAHCEVFHKCPSCPMAFKSSASAGNHISSQHPSLSNSQAKMIYKCVMCDTVFTQKPLLYTHFDTHLAKQKVHVFKCPDCIKLYAQRGSMMEHVKTFHRGLPGKDEAPVTSTPFSPARRLKPSSAADNSDGEDWATEEEEAKEEDGQAGKGAGEQEPDDTTSSPEVGRSLSLHTAPLGWACAHCGLQFPERDDYVNHMKREHGKSIKKFPCRMCERSFSSAPSLRRHVRVNHEGIKRVFQCQFCTEGKRTFSSRLILENHTRVRHGMKTKDYETSEVSRKRLASNRHPGGSNDSSSDPEGEGARAAEEEEARLQNTDRGEEDSAEERKPAKRVRRAEAAPADGRFHCIPCGFSTEDQHEFLQHIPQHRAEAGARCSQCTQCGACFASASSLSRHCFITHRVRHTQVPPTGATPHLSPSPHRADEDTEDSLGCRVCGRHFDKASDLNTHFRTHGMAFIAAHKTDKPL